MSLLTRLVQILIYALKDRYSKSGARKVEQGQFAITDAKTNRDIRLNREWKRCFRPGQRVNMSLFFNEPASGTTTCPSCRTECPGTQDSENTWYLYLRLPGYLEDEFGILTLSL